MKHAKTVVSAERLEEMLIAELRQRGFRNVKGVGLNHLAPPADPNWSIGVCNFGGDDISACLAALREFVPGYASQYLIELKKLW